MFRRMLLPILILPVNVLVIIPGLLLWIFAGTPAGGTWAGAALPRMWAGLVLGLAGLPLSVWTVALFLTRGRGTPAPWDPPQSLVVRGPYRHVRNPMIFSVFLMLAGEAVFLWSPALACWAGAFVTANLIYIPRVEEPRLTRRFGDSYEQYRANVPRWIPRLSPWPGGQ